MIQQFHPLLGRRLRLLPSSLMFIASLGLMSGVLGKAWAADPVAATAPSTLGLNETPTTVPTAVPTNETAAVETDQPTEPVAPEALDTRIQEAKSDVIQLNRDLLVLEEELLFPANTQFALFVSMDVGKMFELDSVQVKVDDKLVANYLYTPAEIQAFIRGGVQRLYLGNLRNGEHELVATFTGRGPHDRDYKRGATVKFVKDAQAKYVELRIQDSTAKMQPEFDIKIWQ